MPKIGHLVNGKFVTVAQDFDVLNAPEATEETSGLMTPTDKKKLNKTYTRDDVASVESVEALFN